MIASTANALEAFSRHGISTNTQFRILGFHGVPDYVIKEFNEPSQGGLGGIFYVKSAKVPGREIQSTDIKYAGFKIPVATVSVYENVWPVTFRTPENYLFRNALEQWSFEEYNEMTSTGSINFPCANAKIDLGLLSKNNGIVRVYTLHNVWLNKLGDISYDMSGDVSEVEFTADFVYSRFSVTPGILDNAGLEILTDEQRQVFEQYRSVIEDSRKTCQ